MKLHLIAFDIPFPANYGGVIDIFYKVKSLTDLGIEVHLHCFAYGKKKQSVELAAVCHKVYYYKRRTHILKQLSLKPYIVVSREDTLLIRNLQLVDAPILFEGVHSCSLLSHPSLVKRIKLVRMHNIEWKYYQYLHELEENNIKKTYFKLESIKLKRFENHVIRYADQILTISPDDTTYFEERSKKVVFIPPFHHNNTVESKLGTGDYALFHGKLSVSDNELAAEYLIKNVFSSLPIPFVIAGMSPSPKLLKLAAPYSNIKIISNPDEKTMIDLIRNAQVNVLISFQQSGMKLKLINALFRGRHCIVNHPMVSNTGLEFLCKIEDSPAALKRSIESLMNIPFGFLHIDDRKKILADLFSNIANAKIIEYLIK
jgi:hypothetical protein